jgi:hypothetical protein
MGELTDLEVEKLKAEIAEELADERYKKSSALQARHLRSGLPRTDVPKGRA